MAVPAEVYGLPIVGAEVTLVMLVDTGDDGGVVCCATTVVESAVVVFPYNGDVVIFDELIADDVEEVEFE